MIAAEPIVAALLGEKWMSAVPVLRILAIFALIKPFGGVAAEALKGEGIELHFGQHASRPYFAMELVRGEPITHFCYPGGHFTPPAVDAVAARARAPRAARAVRVAARAPVPVRVGPGAAAAAPERARARPVRAGPPRAAVPR